MENYCECDKPKSDHLCDKCGKKKNPMEKQYPKFI